METLPSIVTPIITSVAIQDNNLMVFRGSNVTFGLEIRQHGVWIPQKLLNVSELPQVMLFNPLGITIIEEGVMTQISTGRYAYTYKTKHTDELGLWTAQFTSRYTNTAHILNNVGIFLLRESIALTFTYFAMKDSDGVVWFVWIDTALQVNVTRELPDVLRIPELINVDPVVWLRVNAADPTMIHRWLWVDVAGQLNGDFFEPVTVPGWNDEVILGSTAGIPCRLAIDIAEQIVVVPVV